MYGVKVRLDRAQKSLWLIEKVTEQSLIRRISRLGYDSNDVLSKLPLTKSPTRARLLVFLEYEEMNAQYDLSGITEAHYACAWYPDVVIEYLHYVLDEIGVPPLSEFQVYRDWISHHHPDHNEKLSALERRWRECLA